MIKPIIPHPVVRAAKGVFSTVDSKIESYQTKIAALVLAFVQHSTVNTEKRVVRLLEDVQSLSRSSLVAILCRMIELLMHRQSSQTE